MGDDGRSKYLVLAAMLFAVSMTFIDMTIVSIAIPEIQKELGLSSTGVQWVVNAYLLSLAALFALGGRLSDILGHRRVVVVGVIIFTVASALNGAAPSGSLAEPWLIVFRAVQGAGAALLFPAALAIVLEGFPIRERGRAMAVFFAVAGGLTAVGPLTGGYLSEWTWRSIFWVNIPVAIIALVLTAFARPSQHPLPERIDWRGALVISAGMGLSVLGLQQSSTWSWGNPATITCIVVGLALLVLFVALELRTRSPLIGMQYFRNRAFLVENIVLFFTMVPFVPIFFFASMYAQIALGWAPSEAGLYLLIFFGGFAPAAQIGGRILDKAGAKSAVLIGCVLCAVGFALWGVNAIDLDASGQWPWMVLAGAGMGFIVGQANTDAVNRVPSRAYGEAVGITQTVRNYGASLGMALLGTLLITVNRHRVEDSLSEFGISTAQADKIVEATTHGGGGDSASFSDQAGSQGERIFEAVQLDFAYGFRWVVYGMALVMAIAFVVGLIGLRMGPAPLPEDADAPVAGSS